MEYGVFKGKTRIPICDPYRILAAVAALASELVAGTDKSEFNELLTGSVCSQRLRMGREVSIQCAQLVSCPPSRPSASETSLVPVYSNKELNQLYR